MSLLLEEVCGKAEAQRVPLSVHLDLTWRCNEKCTHCYLEHGGTEELATGQVKRLLDQLAEAGTLFLCISGGEVFLRPDLLEILEHARRLVFAVTLKTNGTLLRERDAAALAGLGISEVNISLYSHRPATHDAITGVHGSFHRSVGAIRRLVRHGVRTRVMHVVMRGNAGDYRSVQALAAGLGAEARIDPTITPAVTGDTAPSELRIGVGELGRLLHDPAAIENVAEFCAAPRPADSASLNEYPCGAGLRACYISPAGDVMPCVTYPLVCGNVRTRSFADIWRDSPELREIREVRKRHLPVCSRCAVVTSCSRCPGLAHMAGNALGPSMLDCEKAYARTGVATPLVPVRGLDESRG